MSRGEPTKTIANARAGGETVLSVHCTGHGVLIGGKDIRGAEALEHMIFVDVPQLDGGCADGAERPRGEDRTDGAPPKDWDG
jgi:hypothetical protein